MNSQQSPFVPAPTLLTEQGHDGFAEGLRLLVNEAMRVERQHVLQAQPYERTATRQGYANGYKPQTLVRRIGPITFSVPQVRGETACYPSALEKGLRSEPARKLALAERYVQGVATRKVSALVEELCGHAVSSPIWSATPATKKSATTASSGTAPSSSPWASAPPASASSSASSSPSVKPKSIGAPSSGVIGSGGHSGG